MDPAEHASKILARIQAIKWEDIDPKLKEDKEVTPKFKKHQDTTTAGKPPATSPHYPNTSYAGNWGNSIGRGFGPKL